MLHNKRGAALLQVLLVTVVLAGMATMLLRANLSRTTTSRQTRRAVSAPMHPGWAQDAGSRRHRAGPCPRLCTPVVLRPRPADDNGVWCFSCDKGRTRRSAP